ncbi:unnamed protein product [Cyprideis torosa]|uniref:Uncharacterized protein n=1 Tax=Cyprideis torosa TaxID=163714 RepID=A0A7R8ZIM3_9CRUS|nr:unnamed protein product [Cyprideis torosa]CAG0885054.1 unnamed protein product [Cyprideis torosa]
MLLVLWAGLTLSRAFSVVASAVPQDTVTFDVFANSSKCQASLNEYAQELRKFTPWAVQMYDSSARNLPRGALTAGNIWNLGSFRECLEIVSDNSEVIRGKYCLLETTFEAEAVEAAGAGPILEGSSFLGICVPDTCQGADFLNEYWTWEDDALHIQVDVIDYIGDCVTLQDSDPFTVSEVIFMKAEVASDSPIVLMKPRSTYERKKKAPPATPQETSSSAENLTFLEPFSTYERRKRPVRVPSTDSDEGDGQKLVFSAKKSDEKQESAPEESVFLQPKMTTRKTRRRQQ